MNALVISSDVCSSPSTLWSKARHMAVPCIDIIDSAVPGPVTVKYFFLALFFGSFVFYLYVYTRTNIIFPTHRDSRDQSVIHTGVR